MSGELEIGNCEVCKTVNVTLHRAVFRYNIKCECHSPNHFEMIKHCSNCVPKEPRTTTIIILTSKLGING